MRFRAKPACQAQNQGNPGTENRTVRVGVFFLNTALSKEIKSPTRLWNSILEWYRLLEQMCLSSELGSYCLMYKCQDWGLFNLSTYSVADRKALEQHHSLYSLWYSTASFQGPRNFSIIWISMGVSCTLAKLWWEAPKKSKPEWPFPSRLLEGTINILFTENIKRYCCHLYMTGKVLTISGSKEIIAFTFPPYIVCN